MFPLLRSDPLLWLILAMGVVALGVFAERSFQLRRERVDVRDFLAGLANALVRGNAREALALCEETPGPVARLARLAIQRRDEPEPRLEAALADAARAETAHMERRVSILDALARAAPLAGLAGTLDGLLRSLLAYRAALPLADPAGIVDGLVVGVATTLAGLAVAIPAQLAHHALRLRIERLSLDLREARSECLRVFFAERHA